jgi:hypothetical protein
MPSITGLRISPPGFKATLVDISASGLLAELGVTFRIGQVVSVTFEGTFSPRTVGARVARSAIAAMTAGGIRYHVALAFMTPLVLDPLPATGAEDGAAPSEAADPPPPDDIVYLW